MSDIEQDSQTTPIYAEERSIAFLDEQNHISLENDDFQTEHPNRIPLDFQKEAYQIHFEEIFNLNLTQNITTTSVSTRSNRSYENYDASEDFFSDQFGLNQQVQEPLEYQPLELSGELSEQNYLASWQQKKQYSELPASNPQEQPPKEDLQNCHDETKNIPKNYIKAIFSFILENGSYLERLFSSSRLNGQNCSLVHFLDYIRLERKTKRYTIERLKSLWLDHQNGKAMRIISFQFLRRRSLTYIFNSKIQKKMHHIKHRGKFIKAIENPSEFTNIK